MWTYRLSRDMAEFRMMEPELVRVADEALGKYKDRNEFEPQNYVMNENDFPDGW